MSDGDGVHDDKQEWSWVSEEGIEHPVSESELTFALSSETIPPFALVWKPGWGEWLPAMQVAELQWALPAGSADAPRKPRLSERGSRVPPPLDLYPEYRERSAKLIAGLINPQQEALFSSPNAAGSSPLAGLRRESTPGPPRVALSSTDRSAPSIIPPRRPEASGLGYGSVGFTKEDEEEATVQIDGDELDRMRLEALLDVPVSDPPLSSPPASPRHPSRARQPSSPEPPSSSVPSFPAPSPRPFDRAAPPSRPSPSAPFLSVPLPAPAPIPPKRSPLVPVAIVAALALGTFGALWLRFSKSPSSAPRSAASSEAPATSAGNPGTMQCQIGRPGSLLGEWAYPKIEPVFANVPGSERIAVGYAQTSRYAVGISVDPRTLEVDKVFSEFLNSPLLTVVPFTSKGQLTFRPTRAAATLQSATAVDGKLPFTFGWTRDGFAVRRETDSVDQISWKSPWSTANVPSIAKLDDATFGFALRAGGERGSVLLGKLTDTADAKGDLTALKLGEGRLGLPSLRVGPSRVLVTFTLGASEGRGDAYLAESKKPELPTTARAVLKVPEGVFSPQAVELSPDAFLLQVTKGEPGNQQVVGQVFDFAANKLGPELFVSPVDQDAHAGTLWVAGKNVFSVYMVRTDQAYALWATRLDCE